MRVSIPTSSPAPVMVSLLNLSHPTKCSGYVLKEESAGFVIGWVWEMRQREELSIQQLLNAFSILALL
jgi:hypothetical protein